MRSPLRSKSSPRSVTSKVKNYPSPVGGWNARDALAAMIPIDAVDLENWYPGTSYCEIRGGYLNHLTAMTGDGKTLVVHNGLSGTNKLFCATVSNVYDASSAGTAGASVASVTNGKFQWVNYGDGTNQWLIMVNGVDKPLYYDGSTWTSVDGGTSPALTGLTTTTIVSVFMSKNRLFFLENNSLSFWYLAAGSAGGALTEFKLGGVAQKGGFLMSGATWTVDGGNGPDDRVVFVTSQGEVIVYSGTNPGDASAWSLVGVYDLGKPLGRKCVIKYGGDLVILTQNGVFPMAGTLQSGPIDYKLALSFKIEGAFTEAARNYGSVFGWTSVIHPVRSALIINVPQSEGGVHEQYVMNTITKAWCKFTSWDAEDFVIFNNDLYYTTSNKVVKAWSGVIDGTDDIVAYAKTAFSYFDSPVQKKFKMFRPLLSVNGPISFLTDIDVDFSNTEISGQASYSVISGAQWDVSNWDVGTWASDLEIVKMWTSPDEWTGYSAAGKIKIATNSLIVQWTSCDYVWEQGSIL